MHLSDRAFGSKLVNGILTCIMQTIFSLISYIHFTVHWNVLCSPYVFQKTLDFSSLSRLDRALSFPSLCNSRSSSKPSLNKATNKPAWCVSSLVHCGDFFFVSKTQTCVMPRDRELWQPLPSSSDAISTLENAVTHQKLQKLPIGKH